MSRVSHNMIGQYDFFTKTSMNSLKERKKERKKERSFDTVYNSMNEIRIFNKWQF